MKKRKLKLKEFSIHPIIMYLLITMGVIILSRILSLLQIQVSYNKINPSTLEMKSKLIPVKNLFNYYGIKFIISNAAKSFVGFTPLSNLLISLIGISVAYASGLIDAFTRRITKKIDNKKLTFLIILIATMSSIINDVGYVLLIPISALIFSANKRSPLLGIITAFCGVAFGYGTTIFVGSSEVNLISDTVLSARLIDQNFHVSLTSNLIIMIVSTILISIIGTFIIEKIIAPKFSNNKTLDLDTSTKEIDIDEILKESEQNKLETEIKEKKGLKKTLIVIIVFLLCFAYMLIPNLPFSGLLLDMNEKVYLKQIFGENSYFQDGFTFMISLMLVISGIVYGITAKTLKSSKDLINKCNSYLSNVGSLVSLIFFASLFISVFKESNIGQVVIALLTKLISQLSFSGIPLILLVMIVIGIANLFNTTPAGKWSIMAPVVVPLMMQSNISPQFSQFILRAADSMTKGITPLLAYFVIYVGYLNIYNNDKKIITIKKAISYILPYCLIITISWILIIIGWYILGAPIGIGINPTL